MPRLVLYDDDGRVLFEGEVSRQNVDLTARFLRRHQAVLRTVASAVRAGRAIQEALGGAPSPLLRAPRARPAKRGRSRPS